MFFAANAVAGIYAGTAAFMAATVVSLAVAWCRYHKLPMMPLVSGVIVLVFGGLTLYLHDETFIKLKPTIVYLAVRRVAWRRAFCSRSRCSSCCSARCSISPRKAGASSPCAGRLFFVAMAVVNELVWRNVSTDAWVSFKAFGFLPLTFLFALAQMPLMQRYSDAPADKDTGTNA